MTGTVPAEFPLARRCPFAEPINAEPSLRGAESRRGAEPRLGAKTEPDQALPGGATGRAPISRVRLTGGSEAWWVAGWQEARSVLADPRFSSDRRREGFPLFTADQEARKRLRSQPIAMIGMDGAEHAESRRAVISEFTVKRIAAMRPRIQEIVDGFIDDLLAAEQHPVDLVQALSLPVPSLVICELLGAPYTDHDFFQSRTSAMLRMGTAPDERQRLADELRSYIDDLITAKESEPADDLFSRQIARQRQAGELDHDGLVGLAFLLLIAGHETTANMISLGVLALLEHPDQLAMITADPARTPMAVEELLRYFSIADAVTARVATEDVSVGGVTIKADDGVLVSGLSADWDPAVFDDPAALAVERGARHHLAFGYGPHQCLGQNLARLELEIVFNTLFRRIPGLRLAVPVDQVPLKTDAGIYGAYELPVTW
ncbi:cytochrome P450 [Actinoplanes sp. KI2]|uniref:cytochrome P450 n=1 Tax=Actinoplanes sp. KI2 TaxID=2983315 RepID=UPI0021D5D95B|nr:cytochrome P450 [Actinoplanes sp. KI2]MCU7727462.1 cytochrome P450 [Actinoplanes sp. KI2]